MKLYEKIRHTLSKNPRSATAITSPARSLGCLPTRSLARPALRCRARATAAASTTAAPHTPTKAVPLGSTTTVPPPQGRAAAGIHNLCHCPPESSLAPPLCPPVNLGLCPDRCIPRTIKSPPAKGRAICLGW
jgi:hypothetical protein